MYDKYINIWKREGKERTTVTIILLHNGCGWLPTQIVM